VTATTTTTTTPCSRTRTLAQPRARSNPTWKQIRTGAGARSGSGSFLTLVLVALFIAFLGDLGVDAWPYVDCSGSNPILALGRVTAHYDHTNSSIGLELDGNFTNAYWAQGYTDAATSACKFFLLYCFCFYFGPRPPQVNRPIPPCCPFPPVQPPRAGDAVSGDGGAQNRRILFPLFLERVSFFFFFWFFARVRCSLGWGRKGRVFLWSLSGCTRRLCATIQPWALLFLASHDHRLHIKNSFYLTVRPLRYQGAFVQQ